MRASSPSRVVRQERPPSRFEGFCQPEAQKKQSRVLRGRAARIVPGSTRNPSTQKRMKNQCARESDLPVPVLELPNPEPVPKPELWLVCPNPVPPPPKKDMMPLGVEGLFLHEENLTTDGGNVEDEIDVATKANGWWRVVREEEEEEEREADAPEK